MKTNEPTISEAMKDAVSAFLNSDRRSVYAIATTGKLNDAEKELAERIAYTYSVNAKRLRLECVLTCQWMKAKDEADDAESAKFYRGAAR